MFSAMFSETEVWISPIVTDVSVFFFVAGFGLAAGIAIPSLFSTNLQAVRINFFEAD
jgi:hypothetical protein